MRDADCVHLFRCKLCIKCLDGKKRCSLPVPPLLSPVQRSKVDAMLHPPQGKSPHSAFISCHFTDALTTYRFLWKQTAVTDSDDHIGSDLEGQAYDEVQEAFSLPTFVKGLNCTLNSLQHSLNMTTNKLAVILKERQMVKVHMVKLGDFQKSLQDQVTAQGKQGEIEELVAGRNKRDGVTGMTRMTKTISHIIQSSSMGACVSRSPSPVYSVVLAPCIKNDCQYHFCHP